MSKDFLSHIIEDFGNKYAGIHLYAKPDGCELHYGPLSFQNSGLINNGRILFSFSVAGFNYYVDISDLYVLETESFFDYEPVLNLWNPGDVSRWIIHNDDLEDVWESYWGDQEPGESQLETWIREGRCPKCGELGEFVNSVMKCSKHGVYGVNE